LAQDGVVRRLLLRLLDQRICDLANLPSYVSVADLFNVVGQLADALCERGYYRQSFLVACSPAMIGLTCG